MLLYGQSRRQLPLPYSSVGAACNVASEYTVCSLAGVVRVGKLIAVNAAWTSSRRVVSRVRTRDNDTFRRDFCPRHVSIFCVMESVHMTSGLLTVWSYGAVSMATVKQCGQCGIYNLLNNLQSLPHMSWKANEILRFIFTALLLCRGTFLPQQFSQSICQTRAWNQRTILHIFCYYMEFIFI